MQQLSRSGRAEEPVARIVDRLDFFSHHFADGDSQQTGLRPSAWEEILQRLAVFSPRIASSATRASNAADRSSRQSGRMSWTFALSP
jgi:hypothetical protein